MSRLDLTSATVAAIVAVTASLGVIGGDLRWLAALGDIVWRTGSIPQGVPFASAPSGHWVNVTVASELALAGLTAGGTRVLLLAQVLAVAAALGLVAWDARRAGATDRATAVALVVVAVGGSTALVVIRVQLFSLVLFALLLLLLRAEARRPSRRIWLVVPLVAVWANLHGAVLVGVAAAASYLVLERARRERLVAAGVLTALPLAVCATPGLWRTPVYYRHLLENEAARMGTGLWAPLSLTKPFDVVYVVSALALLAGALRKRPALWELVVLAALAALSIHASRAGIWLLLAAAAPAARAMRARARSASRLTGPLLTVSALVLVLGLVRGPSETGAGDRLVDHAVQAARGTSILATDVIAEQVAYDGGRVWVGNPLDAFAPTDQRLYLDWSEGKGAGDAALVEAPRVIMARAGSRPARRLALRSDWQVAGRDARAVLFVRR